MSEDHSRLHGKGFSGTAAWAIGLESVTDGILAADFVEVRSSSACMRQSEWASAELDLYYWALAVY